MAVIIDYQNIHLTAHGRFCAEGEPVHECLIHPLHFANQVLSTRRNSRALRGITEPHADLGLVRAFRGLPSATHDPNGNRRSQAQRSEWTRDRRVEVTYRPLRYSQDHWGDWKAREKGIDVLVALNLVGLAQSGAYDLVVLACHDTDQEPALEYAVQAEPVVSGRTRIETTGWTDQKRLKGGAAWHTVLDRTAFERCIDRRDYS